MKRYLPYLIPCLAIPAVIAAGVVLFHGRQYAWISLCVAILACLPFFLRFERKQEDQRVLMIIAVMVALSVIGRILFAPIPGFKPVTAMVIITALYFGSQAGFMTGALTAVISNFYFGQGPWTPFQMFVWGLIGLLAGLLSKPLLRSKILLAIAGALSGVLFSLLMDVWSAVWAAEMEGSGFLSSFGRRYLALTLSSAPFMLIYAVSNVIFLLLLTRPIGKILNRIKTKFGIA